MEIPVKRKELRRPRESAQTPVGISKMTMLAVYTPLAMNTSKMSSPAPSSSSVLMPQMSEADNVYSPRNDEIAANHACGSLTILAFIPPRVTRLYPLLLAHCISIPANLVGCLWNSNARLGCSLVSASILGRTRRPVNEA